MLVFRERVETGALREKPLGGEKRINKLNATHESNRAFSWTGTIMRWRLLAEKIIPHQPPFGARSSATARTHSPRFEVALHAKWPTIIVCAGKCDKKFSVETKNNLILLFLTFKARDIYIYLTEFWKRWLARFSMAAAWNLGGAASRDAWVNSRCPELWTSGWLALARAEQSYLKGGG